jgi:hypothetical protein
MESPSIVVTKMIGHFFATTDVSIVSIGQITAEKSQSKAMATELVTGTAQFLLIAYDTERSEQLRSRVAGKLFQLTTQDRGAFVIRQVSYQEPRSNHAQAGIKRGKPA